MSKTLLTTNDVPKYIREIVSNLHPVPGYVENELPGYTFRLYGKWPRGYENQLVENCERLLSWCKRYYADAYIVKEHFWITDVEYPSHLGIGTKQHKAKAARQGFRNYITIVITDPVAHRFEKDSFYRQKSRKED